MQFTSGENGRGTFYAILKLLFKIDPADSVTFSEDP